jgi:hypothetical protein
VDRVDVLESSVPEAFRASAVERFRVTPFEPAVRYGRPVKSVKRVELRFVPTSGALDTGPTSNR